MFAAEIWKRRVAHMRGYPQWRWHLDEVFVKINGKLCYLWRAVDHEGEVLEAVATTKRDKAAALKLLKRIIKKYGAPRSIVTDGLRAYSAAMNEIGVAAERHEVGGRTQQPRRKFASAVSATRTGDAALSKSGDAAEVQLNSRPGAQPIQSGAPSRHEASLQAETLCCLGRVARSRGIDRLSQTRVALHVDLAAVTLTPPGGAMAAMSDRLLRALAFNPFEPLDGHRFADRVMTRRGPAAHLARPHRIDHPIAQVLRIRFCHLLLASAQPAG